MKVNRWKKRMDKLCKWCTKENLAKYGGAICSVIPSTFDKDCCLEASFATAIVWLLFIKLVTSKRVYKYALSQEVTYRCKYPLRPQKDVVRYMRAVERKMSLFLFRDRLTRDEENQVGRLIQLAHSNGKQIAIINKNNNIEIVV